MAGGYSNVRTTIKRRDEIINNAPKYGINIRKDIIESDYSVEGGNMVMQKILQWSTLPQAIICVNDLVATGLLSEVHKNKLSVPRDIAIVGYDNLDISQFIYPGITTIATNYKVYSDAIVSAIQNVDQMDLTTKISISRDIIIRGTTQI